jgi:hypothetical protein
MLFLAKNSVVKKKRETVRCRDATASFLWPKFPSEIFAHFHAVAVKRCISVRN